VNTVYGHTHLDGIGRTNVNTLTHWLSVRKLFTERQGRAESGVGRTIRTPAKITVKSASVCSVLCVRIELKIAYEMKMKQKKLHRNVKMIFDRSKVAGF
jgi:hypothetical protein